MNYNSIILHYKNNFNSKVFLTRLQHEKKDFYIMYVYEYDKELENFKETFLNYLPFYVRNRDYLETLEEENLAEQLIERSKNIRKNSKIIPQRKIENDGIYGELFLDYYLRIIKNMKPIITYSSRRSYKSKRESLGIDNVVYFIDNSNIHFCLCEAKFIAGASNAKEKLIEDIKGKKQSVGHVTKEYINDYMYFVVEKGINIEKDDRDIFQQFINEANRRLDKNDNFLDLMIEKNFCIHFIFFAIFDSQKRNPCLIADYYDEIYNACKENVLRLGVSNYKIEIVFIPTENTTMTIKKEIEKAYE